MSVMVEEPGPKHFVRWIRLILGLFALAAVIIIGNALITELLERIFGENTVDSQSMTLMLYLGVLLYVLLLAIPFVPGAEVGMALLTIAGAKAAPIVYAATVFSLCLAFCIGRFIPERTVVMALRWIGLKRGPDLIERFAELSPEARLRALVTAPEGRFVPLLAKRRYLALALAINLPGNVLIGGGGGIAMMAGISRLFTFTGFLIMTLLAVLPVPLLIVLYGKIWAV